MKKTLGSGNWLHWSHRVFYLVPVLLLQLGYIIFLIIFLHRYRKDLSMITDVQKTQTVKANHSSVFIFTQQDNGAYSGWQYLPTTFAVILGLAWEPVDAAVRLLEPYHQLRQPEGATCRDSLTLDYITAFTYLVPVTSAMRKHWVVCLSSVIYILANTVLPAMTGAMWTINWAPVVGDLDAPAYATISMNEPVVIATCVMNGAMILMGIALMIVVQTRRTGLSRNPKSVGGIASLICESNIILLFHNINTWASTDLIENALSNVRFFLQEGTGHYDNGIEYQRMQITSRIIGEHLASHAIERGQSPKQAHGNWLTKWRVWGSEIFFLMTQSIIVPAAGMASKFASDSNSFNVSVKPQIIKISYVVIISISANLFQWIHRDIHIFAPYRRFQTVTPPEKFFQAMNREFISLGQLITLFKGLATQSFLMAWFAFSSIVFLIATIFFPVIYEMVFNLMVELSPSPGSPGADLVGDQWLPYEKRIPAGKLSYYHNLEYWAIAIHVLLGVNFITILATHQCRPFMPRKPTTLGSNILYICNSRRLLSHFRGTSCMGKKQFKEVLEKVKQSTWFGWFWDGERQGAYVGIEILDPSFDNRVMVFQYNGAYPNVRY